MNRKNTTQREAIKNNVLSKDIIATWKKISKEEKFRGDSYIKYKIAEIMEESNLKTYFIEAIRQFNQFGYLTVTESMAYANKTSELRNAIKSHYGEETCNTIVKHYFFI